MIILKKPLDHSTFSRESRTSYLAWAMVLAAVLFAAFVRIRLLNIPLERDEGEFAYAAQLILEGIPPYVLAYSMKFPGIYAAYAVIMQVFGQTVAGIHLGLLLVNAGAIVLVFLLTESLVDAYAGSVAALSYAILSTSSTVFGTSAHATHFVLLPALGGIALLLMVTDSYRGSTLFCSGLLLGLAFTAKQPGVLFSVFAVLVIIYSELRSQPFVWQSLVRKLLIFSVGLAIPIGVICLLLLAAGVFENFLFWTVLYAHEYVSELNVATAFPIFLDSISRITIPSILIWLLAAAGLFAFFWDRRLRVNSYFVVGFLVFSFLAVCPGLYFRRHYFVLMLPAVALLAGAAVSSLSNALGGGNRTGRRLAPILVCLIAFGFTLFQQRSFLFQLSPHEACLSMYGANPFPESIEIAKYITAHSEPDELIAVIGSEPQIYFYSQRHSATGYIYTYGLMEKQKYAQEMQTQMIAEIEAAKPKYLVFIKVATSWLVRRDSSDLIFRWFNDYATKYYETAGVIDILSANNTVYRWDDEAIRYSPRSSSYVVLFKRKNQ